MLSEDNVETEKLSTTNLVLEYLDEKINEALENEKMIEAGHTAINLEPQRSVRLRELREKAARGDYEGLGLLIDGDLKHAEFYGDHDRRSLEEGFQDDSYFNELSGLINDGEDMLKRTLIDQDRSFVMRVLGNFLKSRAATDRGRALTSMTKLDLKIEKLQAIKMEVQPTNIPPSP